VLDPDLVEFVLAALPPSPARVLEVGAGTGELAGALTTAGYDVLAIDPASETPAVRAVALHELDEPPASFDAALAVVSLHHVNPLVESCRRLGELVRTGGRLVVDEFDVERLDERAARWRLDQRPADHPHIAQDGHNHEPAGIVADLQKHLHPLRRLREALDEWFELEEPVRGPYLHRWDLPPGLRASEVGLIAASRLPETGARMVGTRR
jgi:SAM-dependent methyltransferase